MELVSTFNCLKLSMQQHLLKQTHHAHILLNRSVMNLKIRALMPSYPLCQKSYIMKNKNTFLGEETFGKFRRDK